MNQNIHTIRDMADANVAATNNVSAMFLSVKLHLVGVLPFETNYDIERFLIQDAQFDDRLVIYLSSFIDL